MELELTPVISLLTKDFFPDDEAAEWKRNKITEILENGKYCDYLAENNNYPDIGEVNCGEEAPDSVTHEIRGRSNFGGTYYKPSNANVKDIPNQLKGNFDCPSGYERIAIAGGTESGARENSLVDCPSFDYKGKGLPDNYFMCAVTDKNGELAIDPQDAFGGFVSELSCDSPTFHCKRGFFRFLTLPLNRFFFQFTGPGRPLSNYKMNATTASQYHELLVAFNGNEKVFAFFKWTPGAFVGGFYTVETATGKTITANPATGVTSCPSGYQPYLFYQQLVKFSQCEHNYEPHASYVCLLASG